MFKGSNKHVFGNLYFQIDSLREVVRELDIVTGQRALSKLEI